MPSFHRENSVNCNNIWPLFLPPTLFLSPPWPVGQHTTFKWVPLEMNLSLSTDYFIKIYSIVRIVFVKYRSIYGLIFPSSSSHSHITTLKIDQKPLPTTDPTVASTFWSHGLAEMAGQRNKWVSWPWRHLGTDLMLKAGPYPLVGCQQITECQHQIRSLWDHDPVGQQQDECAGPKIPNALSSLP